MNTYFDDCEIWETDDDNLWHTIAEFLHQGYDDSYDFNDNIMTHGD